jgi:hypothetical protein
MPDEGNSSQISDLMPKKVRKMPAPKPACDKETLAARKAAIARANGAKSRGPISAQGKARSSRNAIKHGIYSTQLILPTESRQDYDDLALQYRDTFHPSSPQEHQLVHEIVSASWTARRQSLQTESPQPARSLDTMSRAEARATARSKGP